MARIWGSFARRKSLPTWRLVARTCARSFSPRARPSTRCAPKHRGWCIPASGLKKSSLPLGEGQGEGLFPTVGDTLTPTLSRGRGSRRHPPLLPAFLRPSGCVEDFLAQTHRRRGNFDQLIVINKPQGLLQIQGADR